MKIGRNPKSYLSINIYNRLSELRLLLPVLLVGSISWANYFIGDSRFKAFQMLSKEQFLGATFGFMSYFYAILIVEVGKELKYEDLLGFLPGSIAEAIRFSKSRDINLKIGKSDIVRIISLLTKIYYKSLFSMLKIESR